MRQKIIHITGITGTRWNKVKVQVYSVISKYALNLYYPGTALPQQYIQHMFIQSVSKAFSHDWRYGMETPDPWITGPMPQPLGHTLNYVYTSVLLLNLGF